MVSVEIIAELPMPMRSYKMSTAGAPTMLHLTKHRLVTAMWLVQAFRLSNVETNLKGSMVIISWILHLLEP